MSSPIVSIPGALGNSNNNDEEDDNSHSCGSNDDGTEDSDSCSNSDSDSDSDPDPDPDPESDLNGSRAPTSDAETSQAPPPEFPFFNCLPPELRHQIWLDAVSLPGINFFNVHSFPKDHPDCNRGTSPPRVYLDLRRISIKHDDETVSRYDRSAWQARNAIRQTCSEAREICTIPASKSATLTLTRPARGLFVRSGDGKLRTMTPSQIAPTIPGPSVEPVVYRTVEVHVDDLLCLSVVNCSFNLPHEEDPVHGGAIEPQPPCIPGPVYDLDDAELEDGWSFDPQLMPRLPLSIDPSRLCAGAGGSFALGDFVGDPYDANLRRTTDALSGVLYGHLPNWNTVSTTDREPWADTMLYVFEDSIQDYNTRTVAELGSSAEIVYDRFGDSYARLPWREMTEHLPTLFKIVKFGHENNAVRDRYLRSAKIHPPKRRAPQRRLLFSQKEPQATSREVAGGLI
ncbi:hypothetical protein SAMD00023353_2401120 [Rosellinia necatrix]|uniref:2EXR domain-containing protein n=1 Tax=Rosellinia necatrix TaxID=77044 RepID=A0A1W2TFU9_ROSNE|nr:hypothetical protein SAMD00023353_2401120 [Rosellinia necatrix]